MKSTEVRIAELKAHLSRYVRAAQNGEEIIIKDRDTPVARLSAIRGMPFRFTPPQRQSRGTGDMVGRKVKGLKPSMVSKVLAQTRTDPNEVWLKEWWNSKGST